MFVRPDYRDPQAYREIENASLRSIAWEFLRRNSAYQSAWAEYAGRVRSIALPDADVSRYVELMLSSNTTADELEKLGDKEKISAIDSQLETLGFLCANPNKPDRLEPLDRQYGEPWGLEIIANPNTKSGGFWVQFKEHGSTIPGVVANLRNADTSPSSMAGLRDTRWLALMVDLSLPLKVIDAQLKQMVRSSRDLKIRKGIIAPINKRDVSPRKYAEYLRLLDAQAAGLTAQQIGEALEPRRTNDGESRQRDKRYAAALVEAMRLQTDGYRALPLLQFDWNLKQKK